jgi:2-polyprenyl-3-methyl-5-hydroxy-6-metoxy-1,4-benzoquinol methylase
MASSQCRLCASDDLRFLQKEENKGAIYTIVQCRRCDVIQTLEHHDIVSPDYANLDIDEIDIDRIWCQGQHKIPAYRQWWKSARKLMGTIEHGAKVLDIGCGTGGFLRFARDKGLTTFGFDASRAQVEYAQKDLPNVRQAISPTKYLEQIDQLDLQFDFVVFWDVLEHLRNPLQFLMEIQTMLRPCGFLFVSVPNGHAMLWKRHIYSFIHKQFSFHPWEHVFYYSPRSLADYLNKSGYDVVCSSTVACYPRPFSVFEAIRRAGFLALKSFPTLAPQISAWARFEKTYLGC